VLVVSHLIPGHIHKTVIATEHNQQPGAKSVSTLIELPDKTDLLSATCLTP